MDRACEFSHDSFFFILQIKLKYCIWYGRNAKGVVVVVILILIFRNPVTPLGIAGYSLTVMGVIAYGEAKRRYKLKQCLQFSQ